MQRYLLDIKADDKPVLLERVLRVVRHRGFIIRQVAATQNHESKVPALRSSLTVIAPFLCWSARSKNCGTFALSMSLRSKPTNSPIITYNKKCVHKEGTRT